LSPHADITVAKLISLSLRSVAAAHCGCHLQIWGQGDGPDGGERHAEEAQCEAEDAPAGAADATEIMSPGEVVVEGVVVEQPAEPATAGEVFGWTKKGLGVKYVGREGIVGPLKSTDAVVDVFAMDRGLFDAANAAKARAHWLHGRPGNLALIDGDCPASVEVQFCCAPPLHTFCSIMACLAPLVCCDCWFCRNWRDPHKDMAFPDWADRALVFTDKGVVGRREFTGRVNAITWDGFRIEDVRIRTFDAPCLCSIRRPVPVPCMCFCCDEHSDPRFDPDPLETACYFGFLGVCGRYAFCRPEAPGLYRATISSIHHKGEGTREWEGPMATIEVLALARSPDDLRSSLRAANEKYRAPTAAAWDNQRRSCVQCRGSLTQSDFSKTQWGKAASGKGRCKKCLGNA
jgi:hypothetical protein